MKATMSKDGIKRVNLRVTHRLSADDFANMLCLEHENHELGDDLPQYTRPLILDMVRHQLTFNPDGRNWWRDNPDEDCADELWAWASDLIRNRFPELY